MLNAPSIACLVLRPIMTPIPAKAGEMLIVWPGHPTLTLCVVTHDGRAIIRESYCPDGVLYGALLDLYLDAKIRCLSDQSERALLRTA